MLANAHDALNGAHDRTKYEDHAASPCSLAEYPVHSGDEEKYRIFDLFFLIYRRFRESGDEGISVDKYRK